MTVINANIPHNSDTGSDGKKNTPTHRRLANILQCMGSHTITSTAPITPVPTFGSTQSLLNDQKLAKQIQQEEWSRILDAKLFAHITADPFIGKTNLEGNQLTTTSQFLYEFLPFLQDKKHLFESAQQKKIQALLLTLKNGSDDPEKVAQKVAALRPGESFLMQGGWKGETGYPGHAMIYEFFRRADGHFDIYIYNTGDGTQYHPQILSTNKILIQRMIKYENVFPAELNLSNSSQSKQDSLFFDALDYCRNHIHANKEKTTAKHIYEEAFGHIAHKRAPARSNLSFFATGQRSGTCTEQVLKPVVFRHLCKEDINTFKKMQFYKKFYATIAFYQKNKPELEQDSSSSDQNRYLLKAAAAKLLRSSAKLFNPVSPDKGLLTRNELLEAKITLEDLQTTIDQIEINLQKTRLQTTQCLQVPSNVVDRNYALIQKIPTVQPSPSTQVFSSPPANLSLGSPKTFVQDLEQLRANIYEIAKTDPQAALHTIEQCIGKLPVPNLKNEMDLCSQLEEIQVARSLDLLYELMGCHAHLASLSASYFPARQNCSLIFLVYMHALAIRHDKALYKEKSELASFSIDCKSFQISTLDPFLVMYDPDTFQKRKDLLAYLEVQPDYKKKIGNFASFHNDREAYLPQEATLLRELIRKDSTLEKNFHKKMQEEHVKSGMKVPLEMFAKLVLLSTFAPKYLASPTAGHVFKLREAAFIGAAVLQLGHLRMKYSPEDSLDAPIFGRCEILYRGSVIYYAYFWKDTPFDPTQDNLNETLKAYAMHPSQQTIHEKLDKLIYILRNQLLHNKTSESYILSQFKQSTNYPPILDTSNVEPSVQISQILRYYSDHLSDFTTSEMQAHTQTIFDLLFFGIRTPPHDPSEVPSEQQTLFNEKNLKVEWLRHEGWYSNKISVPLFNELSTNTALQKQCVDFIQQGLNLFYQRQPRQRPVVPTCLFFIRLGARLQGVCPSIALPDHRPLLRSWLTLKSLSLQEKSQIHQHLLLQYTGRSSLKMSNEEIQEVIGSWFYYNQYPVGSTFQSSHLHEEARNVIYSGSHELSERLQEPKTRDSLCNHILQSFKCETAQTPWEPQPAHPCYQQKKTNGGYWQINLLKGQIADETGIFISGDSTDPTQSADYARIFGRRTIPMQRTNQGFTFNAPPYGTMRLLSKAEGGWVFQRELGGKWHEYVPPTKLLSLDLPHSLIADHSHWASLEEGEERTLVISPLANPSQCTAIMNSQGCQLPHNLRLFATNVSDLSGFETSKWVHILSQDGSSIEQIDLPRYCSQTGKPLSFVKSNDRLAWAENPAFLLDCSRQGLLGSIPNYVMLTNKTNGIQKILVPMQPIVSKNQSIDRQIEIDVVDQHRENEYEKAGEPSGILCPQNKEYLFLEYNVEGNAISPINTEGVLYYSYLLLAQKKYTEAKKVLAQIPQGEVLSETSLDILHMFEKMPGLNQDNSPASIAIRLYAFRLYANVATEPQWADAQDPPPQMIKDLFDAYANGINHVPPSLRLVNQDVENLRKYTKNSLPLPVTFNPIQEVAPVPITDPVAWLEAPLERHSFPDSWNLDVRSSIARTDLPNRFDASETSILDYFGHLYEKARTLTTLEEDMWVKSMLNVLRSMPKDADLKEKKCLIALIRLAYLYPKSAPAIDPKADAGKWLEAASKVYTNLQRQKAPFERALFSLQKFSAGNVPTMIEQRTTRLPFSKKSAKIPQRTLSLPPLGGASLDPLHLFNEAERHFKSIPSSGLLQNTPQFKAVEDEASLIFEKAIQAELTEFQKDYEAGVQKSAQRINYALKDKKSLPALQATLTGKIQTEQKSVNELIEQIQAIAQKKPASHPMQLHESLLQRGEVIDFTSMSQLTQIFLYGQASRYGVINPHLRANDVDKLDQLMLQYLVANTALTQAKRALSQVQALTKLPPSEDTRLLENQLCQTLSAKRHYMPHEERAFLVFEEQSGMRLREAQVGLLRKMLQRKTSASQYRDIVAQLMMGGGKTTVIASILLHLTAKEGKIPLFFAPTAQFESLRSNLSIAQEKHFTQAVVPLDLPRNLMTAENLTWFLNKLENAQKNGSVLLMKAENLQFLQLEFLSCLHKRSRADTRAPKDLDTKITSLQKILSLFAEEADVIFDEVDVLLAPHKVANVPIGDMTLVDPSLVTLMQTIAKLHIDETLRLPDGRSVNDILRLRDKEKPTLDSQQYKQTIQPIIADALFENIHEKWNLDKQFANSFKRYVLGVMTPSNLSLEDQRFLHMFEKLGNSTTFLEKETADQLALSRLFFQSILPSILMNFANRNFGRTKSAPFGKVIPFVGADAPATTEFASPWEAGFNHYLTAFHSAIQQSQLRTLAEHYLSVVEHQTRKTHKPIDEMAEAKAFLALTGVPLVEIDLPGNLEKATAYVNQDIERIIQCESATISSLVGYYTQYLSSNAQNLTAQIQSSKRALSGTPYNIPTYPASLQQDPALDVGVEGEIAHALIQRNCPIYTYQTNEIGSILDTAIKNGMPRDRLHGFIDTASVLKNYSNEEVAQQILEFYKNDPSIDTVLFFGRRKPTDMTADCLMVLKKGSAKSEIIGSTRADALEKAGINLNRTFVFYDERHCEATDLPQKPDAINLLSIDSTLTRRTFSQGALRLRQFFEGQTIACVVQEEERKKMVNQGQIIQDVLVSLCKNQAIGKANQTHRAFTQKIDHVPRQASIHALLKAPDPLSAAELFLQFEPFLISTQQMDPFKLYGGLQELVPTQETLQQQVKTVQARIEATPNERARRLLGHLGGDLNQLVNESAKQAYLPKMILKGQQDAIGLAMETQQEAQAEVQVELETELQQELQRYGGNGAGLSYIETGWKPEAIRGPTFPFECPTKVYPLPKLFEKTNYTMPYGEIFDSNLLVSENLALTDTEHLSVFNKKQKPAANLLVWMKDNKLHFLLVSIRETAIFKKYIQETKAADMWLLLSDGNEQLSDPKHISLNLAQQQELDRALLQMNLFNGNAKYLDLNEERTKSFLQDKNAPLVNRFLKLKVEKDPGQRKVFYQSALLNPLKSKV